MFDHLLLHAQQLVLKSGGHMETGTGLQQDNAVSVFNHMLVHFHMQILKHLIVTSAISIMWYAVQKQRFLSVTKYSQHHFNGKWLWLWISSVRTKWGASPTSVLVFLWVRNGDTTFHCLWQYAAEMHHLQYGTSSNVLVILIRSAPCVCQQVGDALWTHPVIPQYHAIVCVVLTPIFIPVTRNERSNVCPCIPRSWLTKILWITDRVSLFNYWHVCHSLPACWQHSVPTHNCSHQYTCSTTDGSDLPINFSRLTPFYSKKLNTTFWSNLDSSTSWYTVFEL